MIKIYQKLVYFYLSYHNYNFINEKTRSLSDNGEEMLLKSNFSKII